MNEDNLNKIDFPAMAASMYAAAHGDQSLWEPQRPHTKDMWIRAAKAGVTFLVELVEDEALTRAGKAATTKLIEAAATNESEGGATDEGRDETDVKDAIAD